MGEVVGEVESVARMQDDAVNRHFLSLTAVEPVRANCRYNLIRRGIYNAVGGRQHPTGSDQGRPAEGVVAGLGEGLDGDDPRPRAGPGLLAANDLSLQFRGRRWCRLDFGCVRHRGCRDQDLTGLPVPHGVCSDRRPGERNSLTSRGVGTNCQSQAVSGVGGALIGPLCPDGY